MQPGGRSTAGRRAATASVQVRYRVLGTPDDPRQHRGLPAGKADPAARPSASDQHRRELPVWKADHAPGFGVRAPPLPNVPHQTARVLSAGVPVHAAAQSQQAAQHQPAGEAPPRRQAQAAPLRTQRGRPAREAAGEPDVRRRYGPAEPALQARPVSPSQQKAPLCAADRIPVQAEASKHQTVAATLVQRHAVRAPVVVRHVEGAGWAMEIPEPLLQLPCLLQYSPEQAARMAANSRAAQRQRRHRTG